MVWRLQIRQIDYTLLGGSYDDVDDNLSDTARAAFDWRPSRLPVQQRLGLLSQWHSGSRSRCRRVDVAVVEKSPRSLGTAVSGDV